LQLYLDQVMTPYHITRIGAASWAYWWLVQRITEDGPDGGLVNGGQAVLIEEIATGLGRSNDAVKTQLKLLEAGGYIRRRRLSQGHIYEVARLPVSTSRPDVTGSSQTATPTVIGSDSSTNKQFYDVAKSRKGDMATTRHDDITTSDPSPSSPSSPLDPSLSSLLVSPLPPSHATKQAIEPTGDRDEGPLGPRWAWAIATGVAARDQPDRVVQALKACEPVSLIDGVLTVRLPANQGQAAMVNGVRQRAVNALRMDKKNLIELNLIRAGPGPETEARAGP
jgi:hypothetical protein